MDLTKLIIVGLALYANECLSGIVQNTSTSEQLTMLAEATVNILSSCYEKEVNAVGLAGTLESALFEHLWNKRGLPATLIGGTEEDVENPLVGRRSGHKLQLFVVIVSSSKQLERNLKQTKRSHWWNHMATFVIVDWRTSVEHDCSNAFQFLWTAWEINVLNALYVCVHRPENRLIYSYNPYVPQAPDPWQLVNTYTADTDHPWTLFVRKNQEGDGFCRNLYFDKTKDLGGYVIRPSVDLPVEQWETLSNKTDVENYGGPLGQFGRIMFHAMNATPDLVVYKQAFNISLIPDTASGINDVCLKPFYHRSVANYTFSCEFGESGLAILTQKRGYVSVASKIINLIDGGSRFGLLLVVLSTIAFFKFVLGNPFGSAIMNTIRILFGSSIAKLPENSAARIYLASAFFVFLNITAIYQGRMAALLTKSVFLQNVDSTHDLVDLNYTIHGYHRYSSYFLDPVFEGRFTGHDETVCIENVLRDSSTAFVADRTVLIVTAKNPNLHLSANNVATMYFVFLIREDWPLERRFNGILLSLFESHITIHKLLDWVTDLTRVNDYHDNQERKEKFRVINLSEITFAFAVLGFGLGCAIVSFMVEMRLK